jgi:hypothetical protein
MMAIPDARMRQPGVKIGNCCVGETGQRAIPSPRLRHPPRGNKIARVIFELVKGTGRGRHIESSIARLSQPFHQGDGSLVPTLSWALSWALWFIFIHCCIRETAKLHRIGYNKNRTGRCWALGLGQRTEYQNDLCLNKGD